MLLVIQEAPLRVVLVALVFNQVLTELPLIVLAVVEVALTLLELLLVDLVVVERLVMGQYLGHPPHLVKMEQLIRVAVLVVADGLTPGL